VGAARRDPPRLGAVFPQTELPADRGAVRAYAQAVADLGFHHVVAYDHVVGADPSLHPEGPALPPTGAGGGWAYTHRDPFHEPFVLFGYLAALVDLELVTGILILPQRQTVLVAKQAAEVDVLTGGRLRLGIGLGWNGVEYEALGTPFADRGRRAEEQVELLRRLWTEPVVTFDGRHHRVTGAGILPLPVQRPIPIWMGARPGSPALRRIGRLADGWITMDVHADSFATSWATIRQAASEAGRDPDALGLEGRIEYRDGDLDRVAAQAAVWRDRGATHVSLNTMRAGLAGVDGHVKALAAMLEAAGPRADR
jgi:probable F420-dependent oxidoreductase